MPDLQPTETEQEQRLVMHRSITAACDIAAGEILNEKNLVLLRPGTGLGAINLKNILGRKAGCDIRAGVRLTWEDIDDEG